MIIRVSQTSDVPLYVQIRDQLVEAIARGELVAGDGLPSVRRLASDLGINLHTVNKAYAVLRDEGYLVMRGRSGAFVADVECAASPERLEGAELHLSDDLRKLALEYKARGGEETSFVNLAAAAARGVYGDPGIAGARRNVRALGVDDAGARIGASAQSASVDRGASAAALDAKGAN